MARTKTNTRTTQKHIENHNATYFQEKQLFLCFSIKKNIFLNDFSKKSWVTAFHLGFKPVLSYMYSEPHTFSTCFEEENEIDFVQPEAQLNERKVKESQIKKKGVKRTES